MGKPIYYKNSKGDGYKLEITTSDLSEIDEFLDHLSGCVFISKKEFESMYKKTMDIDVMDEHSEIVLGKLTTEYLEGLEDGDRI